MLFNSSWKVYLALFTLRLKIKLFLSKVNLNPKSKDDNSIHKEEFVNTVVLDT